VVWSLTRGAFGRVPDPEVYALMVVRADRNGKGACGPCKRLSMCSSRPTPALSPNLLASIQGIRSQTALTMQTELPALDRVPTPRTAGWH
jgi:hypothetical protein